MMEEVQVRLLLVAVVMLLLLKTRRPAMRSL
jgi:hypothetical protein